MKKTFFLVLALVLAWNFSAQALETTLIDTRNEILKTSEELKTYFTTTRDPVLLNSLWDSSIMAVSQLDAYFSMLGIFNTIKKENLDQAAFTYLIKWLNQLKDSTASNIKSLSSIKKTTDARSKAYVLKLKDIFSNLESRIDKELQSVTKYSESIKQ
ncbi:MAG TPA: hypothetical protein PL125_04725 [Candidatus Omnitrophota bacterium]|nr:hypothetical protein [Candidatus Omnitrophota bacterium]HPT39484.1 hypothetical protein [Candidatus Omnitrophota bacterium]